MPSLVVAWPAFCLGISMNRPLTGVRLGLLQHELKPLPADGHRQYDEPVVVFTRIHGEIVRYVLAQHSVFIIRCVNVV
jgi:hypothetical protein